MANRLADFAEAHLQLKSARAGFTPYKETWYAWNYWAQHNAQFSFSSWMAENNLEFEDVQAKARIPEAEVNYDREEGYRYYSAWRGANEAVAAAEQKFEKLFEEVMTSKEYTPEQIGAAIGKTRDQLLKFAAKKSWYKPSRKRKEKK